MKICFITEDFYPDFIGGQGVYGFHLTQELIKKGHQVSVIAENRGKRKEYWKKTSPLPSPTRRGTKGEVLFIPYCFGNQLLLALLEYLYFIFKLKDQQFDILHANQLSGFFFALFKPSNVKKVIISAHNTNYDMYQVTDSIIKRILYLPLIFLEKIMYGRADGLLFNSSSEKNALVNYYSIANKKIGIAYLGKPDTKFSPSEKSQFRSLIRKKIAIDKEAKIVLYVGRIVKKKRVDLLVQALKKLHNQGLPISAIIIGKGNLLKKLNQDAPDYIHFLGFVKETKPYFLASDIFITTGVAEGGIALSALEAAHFQLPLILSPDDADVPILKEGINGYLADPNNPFDIAQKIKKVLLRTQSMGIESGKLAKKFSWKRCAEETIRFYRLVTSY